MNEVTQAVADAVDQTFPEDQKQQVIAALASYSSNTNSDSNEKVQLAIVDISEGDLAKLLHNVEVAKTDFRDILYWQELKHQEIKKVDQDNIN